MTVYRELYATRDGLSRLVATERDDAEGRHIIEQTAFRLMALPAVESCSTVRTTRHTKRKGTTR